MNERMRISSRRRRIAASFLLLSAVAVPACHRPIQPEAPTAAVIVEEDRTALWESALESLRRFGFTPDRQDRALGVITTYPETTKQWHEFWRRDAVGAYDKMLASFHTVQRHVTVTFAHDANWTVSVQVDVSRLHAPESQVTTASSAIHSFSGLLPTDEGATGVQARTQRDWVPLGRDAAMEERILDSILSRAPLYAYDEIAAAN